ncbi:hypothetical protein RRG08_024948 [Elysia crispata]|uniref:Sodium-coupled monocarboxylate transporter 1 n=1 Tax=Elysia crispata TaxID=231223 RepID=A0AAE0Z3K1_9GAST|nr:hypothetical protein RRG08_024948 [Elysia crispata]
MDETASCSDVGEPQEPIFEGDYSFNTGIKRHITLADFLIFVSSLVASTAIGFYQAWRFKNNLGLEEYLIAGRSMSAFPVGLSMLASFVSTISMIGHSVEVYNYDTLYVWDAVGYVFGIATAAYLYIPVFYHLRITTAYQYLELRFSRSLRFVVAVLFVINMTTYMSIVLFAPSIAINAVTGLGLWGSTYTVGVICTLYTAFGGMKAVIYTDVFQFILVFVGSIVLLIKALIKVGWIALSESAGRTNRLKFFDFRLDPTIRHTVWNLAIGHSFTILTLYGVNQVLVHRCLACKTLRNAKIALLINILGRCAFLSIFVSIGLCMSAFYEYCDPQRAQLISHSNELLSLFMMDVLDDVTGLPGLFLASMFNAALGTFSSGLHSISAVIVEDIIKVYVTAHLGENRERLTMQLIAIMFGAVCVEFSFLFFETESILRAKIANLSLLSGPLLGVFSLGIFFPWANTGDNLYKFCLISYQGAMAGLFGSIFFLGLLLVRKGISTPLTSESKFGHGCVNNCNSTALDITPLMAEVETNPERHVYHLSYMWYSFIGTTLCVLVGLVVSYATGFRDPRQIDPRLIVPFFDHVFPFYYLPETTREKLRFGINHEGKFNVMSRTISRTSYASSRTKSKATTDSGIIPVKHRSSSELHWRYPGSVISREKTLGTEV